MRAIIGTLNPGKIEGAKEALEVFYKDIELIGYKAESNVSDQPVNKETLVGARNRVRNTMKYALENNIDVDFYMAIESGIVQLYGKWYIMNLAVIKDRDGFESVGFGPGFPVPKKYVKEIIATEFGKVMDKVFDATDLSKSVGGVNSLTNGAISRIQITKEAFIMALTSHYNKYWSDKEETKGRKI